MLRRVAVLMLMAATLFPSAAMAGRLLRVQGQPLRQACAADYLRLCRGVPLGGGRVLTCLNAQADQLSQTCFQALAARGLAYAGTLKICRPDYERLCAGTPPGWGRGVQCMVDNLASLSAECRNALQQQGFIGGGDGAMP